MQMDLDSFIVWLLTQLDTDSGDAEREARMSCHGQMRKRNSYTLTAMKKVKSLYNKSVRTDSKSLTQARSTHTSASS